MRSRTARLAFGVLALIAIGVAAFFLLESEKQIARRRADVRTFDLKAREATLALADVRAAQQAYVAAGQGVAFWMPRVASLIEQAAGATDRLRAVATSVPAREFLLQAAAAITEFDNVDRRARDYLRAEQPLMAGDVVFTEGGETAAQAARLIEASRLAEYQALDGSEALLRRREASALAAAVAITLVVLFVLALIRPGAARDAAPAETASPGEAVDGHLRLREPFRSTEADLTPRQSLPALRAAAELCTEFGRVNDVEDLKKLLVRAADALDASGVIVWLGSPSGADLRPVLAHGYPAQALARMQPIPRAADNAAAAAYRTSGLQIVLCRPGVASGAIVAPLLTPEGCIGSLTAEINDRGETSDAVQALAAIFAAQLAGVLGSSVATGAAADAAREKQIAI